MTIVEGIISSGEPLRIKKRNGYNKAKVKILLSHKITKSKKKRKKGDLNKARKELDKLIWGS